MSVKLLFVCTHNRCRSILCEAISNFQGEGRLEARSAGSSPVAEVHPLTLQYLFEAGVPLAGLHSKSWSDLGDFHPDLVITVCDSAAGEACPLYLASVPRLHWGLADPSKLEGNSEEVALAFRATISQIQARTLSLLALPIETLNGQQLAAALANLALSKA